MAESFVFYESYYNAIQSIKTTKGKLAAYDRICRYGLFQEFPKEEAGMEGADIVFFIAKENLDACRRSRENGKRGGAPFGNKNAAKKKELEELEE